MNRRTFLGIIPAAAGISALVAAPAKLPTLIPIVESLEEVPPSGPAILAIGCQDKGGPELFVPMMDRKALWIVTGGTPGALSSFVLHVSMAHQMLNVHLLGKAPKTWIWAATHHEAEAEAGRVLGGG